MEKLDHKMFGPYVVKRMVASRANELELPTQWTLHSVFNVGMLELYREDPIICPQTEVLALDIVYIESNYIVSVVVDSQ